MTMTMSVSAVCMPVAAHRGGVRLPSVERHHDGQHRRLQSIRAIDDVEAIMRAAGVGDRAELLGELVADHLDSGGKRVRARLALAAASALGVPRTAAAPWAAAVEMLHNATLVHDDLQDGDRLRRGHPTTWAVHGMPQAVNTGDLMLMLPVMMAGAVNVDEAIRFRLCQALARRAAATVRGQAADLSLHDAIDRGGDPVDVYLRCIEGKTGELFALPVEGAALMAGFDVGRAAALAEPFFLLGMLFQLQDDVLDLFGDKGREARGADVKEGKISALVVEHLRLHPGDREWLLAILRAPRDVTSDDDVLAVIDSFEVGGAKDAVLARIAHLATRALNTPAIDDAPELRAIVVEVIGVVLQPIQGLFTRQDHDAVAGAPESIIDTDTVLSTEVRS
jgi:geranylgeranyl diphosphate synthase type I